MRYCFVTGRYDTNYELKCLRRAYLEEVKKNSTPLKLWKPLPYIPAFTSTVESCKHNVDLTKLVPFMEVGVQSKYPFQPSVNHREFKNDRVWTEQESNCAIIDSFTNPQENTTFSRNQQFVCYTPYELVDEYDKKKLIEKGELETDAFCPVTTIGPLRRSDGSSHRNATVTLHGQSAKEVSAPEFNDLLLMLGYKREETTPPKLGDIMGLVDVMMYEDVETRLRFEDVYDREGCLKYIKSFPIGDCFLKGYDVTNVLPYVMFRDFMEFLRGMSRFRQAIVDGKSKQWHINWY